MFNQNASRRDVLKATGLGALGLAGLSTAATPAASHESVEASATDLLGPIQVPASREEGFNYPYYLYVPEAVQDEPVPMLVEPNNTGTTTDDFEEHRVAARKVSEGRLGWTRTYSEALTVPLLVPVFPRPLSDPVGGNHYVHALDETTMNLDGGELERVDLQLVSMIEHAQGLLDELSYPVADEILLNGFSASGNFVNRFTALHPDLITSVTAGGINGTLLLPLERAKGHTLNYHIGVADLEEITGEPFDAETWRDVAQFIYMGGDDENDTIPYSDAWNDTQREIALDVYGEHMQDDRMPYCERVYEDAGADARFEIYEGVGHRQPLEVQRDIVAFHRENAALKQISFSRIPATGDVVVEADVAVFDDRDRFDLRVRSDERGDITDAPTEIEAGGAVHASVDLATPIEQGERVSAVAVPAGTTDPDRAVASATRTIAETPSIRVIEHPTAADHSVTVSHAISADYETATPIHVYLSPEGDGSNQMVGTFPPGTAGRATYQLDPAELDATLDTGTRLRASLVDVDANETLATATVEVGGGGQTSSEPSASVAFDSQPTAGRERIAVRYSVDDAYEPTEFATLQLRVGEDYTFLLDALEPGDGATETYSLEKVPLEAGDRIEVSVADQSPISRSRTVVVGDANDEVTVRFTERPTDDDPTATVSYAIDETYQPRDALTLRAYADGVPGSIPGDALRLLSAGDSGTETITLREDVATPSGDLTVAVVDDAPLALASTADPLGDEVPAEQAGATEEPTPTENPTPTEEASTETESVAATDEPTPTEKDAVSGDGPEARTETETDGDAVTETAVGADGPGFGVGTALGSVGGLSYLLKRRLDDASGDGEDAGVS